MKKISHIRSKKSAAYVMGDFVTIKIFKKMLNCTKKSEIIVITLEDLEELLIVFAIYVIKYQKNFPYLFIIVLHMMIILKLNN